MSFVLDSAVALGQFIERGLDKFDPTRDIVAAHAYKLAQPFLESTEEVRDNPLFSGLRLDAAEGILRQINELGTHSIEVSTFIEGLSEYLVTGGGRTVNAFTYKPITPADY